MKYYKIKIKYHVISLANGEAVREIHGNGKIFLI